MMRLICILGLLTVCHAAAPIDLACTAEGKYTYEAIICEDVEDYCKDIQTTPVVNGTDAERSPLCFSKGDGKAIDKDMKATAIKDCPKTCGYCCLTDAWSCKNKGESHMNCDGITPGMCKNPAWKDRITSFCPNKCGFCTSESCVDLDPEYCGRLPNICTDVRTVEYAMVNCARTCENCDGRKTITKKTLALTTTTANPKCKDTSEKCASWEEFGYCGNVGFSITSKIAQCAKTCNLCS